MGWRYGQSITVEKGMATIAALDSDDRSRNASHTIPTARKREWDENWSSIFLLLQIKCETPQGLNVQPTFRVRLPSSVKPLWKNPHRWDQKCISYVTPKHSSSQWRMTTTVIHLLLPCISLYTHARGWMILYLRDSMYRTQCRTPLNFLQMRGLTFSLEYLFL